MVTAQPTFRRLRLRDAFTRATTPTLVGWRLLGPAGAVADRLRAADTPARRLRGLLGRPPLEAGEAFVIRPCSQVHTIGMRYPIDAVFCDRNLRVLDVQRLATGRMSRMVRRAWCCIELPSGTAESCAIEPGVQLRLEAPDVR